MLDEDVQTAHDLAGLQRHENILQRIFQNDRKEIVAARRADRRSEQIRPRSGVEVVEVTDHAINAVSIAYLRCPNPGARDFSPSWRGPSLQSEERE